MDNRNNKIAKTINKMVNRINIMAGIMDNNYRNKTPLQNGVFVLKYAMIFYLKSLQRC